MLSLGASALADSSAMPHIEKQNGRYALFVDGAPYLMLGAQVHNSSACPAMLPKVWPAMKALHVNTVEIPVYWEQIEPVQGKFDFSLVDVLLQQAREHNVRLDLLWFATWKNGSGHYQPEWMKLRPDLYPRMVGVDGKLIDSPSPHSIPAMKADCNAFAHLMGHLKEADPQHTVIIVQVENEPGTWGGIRDHASIGQKLFDAPVPADLLAALHVGQPGNTWTQAFGRDADEFFHAYSVAHYIGQVAAAGKAVYPLPMYVNASLRDPVNPEWPPHYEVGGATDNVLSIWKAAAPAIDILAPDIYISDPQKYQVVLDHYARPDNPLFVPETGGDVSRFLYSALDRGTIGFSPFGMDYTGFPVPADSFSDGSEHLETFLAPYALNYIQLGPIMREVARLNFEGKLRATAELPGEASTKLDFDGWTANVEYGAARFDAPKGNEKPQGRALVAQLAPDQFLVTGNFCKILFHPKSGLPWQYLKVEEGTYENGVFKPYRIWNGDETDWGINFKELPQVLRVSLYEIHQLQ